MSKPEPKFSKTVWILKDVKKKTSWDVIRVTHRVDNKPVLFDFGAGNVMVIRYTIETFDGLINLFVPAVNSFIKKLALNKYYELGSKRCYNYELSETKTNDWIIYVNRIKNLTQVNLKLGDRLEWQAQPKTKDIEFPFDESWLEKSLPIKNNLVDCRNYFENLEDVDPDTLLSAPLKILRLQVGNQIEVVEPSGSIIKNVEFMALSHTNKLVRLYVPYFLKDLVNNISEKLIQYNIVINRLKVFYKKAGRESYAGFLWDPTLSGFIFLPKDEDDRKLDLKDGEDIFGKVDGHSLIEYIINDHRQTEEKLKSMKKRGSSRPRRSGFETHDYEETGYENVEGKKGPKKRSSSKKGFGNSGNKGDDDYGYIDF